MALEKIKQMLQESIGLHSRSIGDASIERAIRHRMFVLNISDDSKYFSMLGADTDEFRELVEEVVVPETWFFRNSSPFDALGNYISEMGRKGRPSPGNPLKILSLPCSTGEEPYSIAMVLMENGLADKRFYIDALDVSRRALDKAKRACYGRNSFREDYRGLQEKYFESTESGFLLKQSVKSHVRFAYSNIIKDSFKDRLKKYDIIFCRNLLIYFDHSTQAEVLEELHAMLKVGGVIFVGHAESSQVPAHLYESLEIPMAFAFRAITDTSETPPYKGFRDVSLSQKRSKSIEDLQSTFQNLVALTEKNELLGKRVSFRRKNRLSKEGHKNIARMTEPVTPLIKEDDGAENDTATLYRDTPLILEEISRLIEQGKLSIAGELAEAYKRDHPESAEAHYYLGLISHFEGGFGSAEFLLKQTLYLNPKHHAAMGLLSLIAEDRGDIEQAELYRRRQQRTIRQDAIKSEGDS